MATDPGRALAANNRSVAPAASTATTKPYTVSVGSATNSPARNRDTAPASSINTRSPACRRAPRAAGHVRVGRHVERTRRVAQRGDGVALVGRMLEDEAARAGEP